MNQVTDVILSRRSVRAYTPRQVEPHLIRAVLEAGSAPPPPMIAAPGTLPSSPPQRGRPGCWPPLRLPSVGIWRPLGSPKKRFPPG